MPISPRTLRISALAIATALLSACGSGVGNNLAAAGASIIPQTNSLSTSGTISSLPQNLSVPVPTTIEPNALTVPPSNLTGTPSPLDAQIQALTAAALAGTAVPSAAVVATSLPNTTLPSTAVPATAVQPQSLAVAAPAAAATPAVVPLSTVRGITRAVLSELAAESPDTLSALLARKKAHLACATGKKKCHAHKMAKLAHVHNSTGDDSALAMWN